MSIDLGLVMSSRGFSEENCYIEALTGPINRVEWDVSKGEYTYGVCFSHPRATRHGYVLLHRLIAENVLERRLEDWEIVHHKDENKKNNNPFNLEVESRSEHTKRHHK